MKRDASGNKAEGGRLNLREMEAGELKYAEFSILFGFKNGQGDEEQWRLSYGTPPGGTEIVWPPRDSRCPSRWIRWVGLMDDYRYVGRTGNTRSSD